MYAQESLIVQYVCILLGKLQRTRQVWFRLFESCEMDDNSRKEVCNQLQKNV